jgi:hypothetical protein
LNETRNLIKNSSKPIGAMIIEPVTAFENQMATPYYYKRLR